MYKTYYSAQYITDTVYIWNCLALALKLHSSMIIRNKFSVLLCIFLLSNDWMACRTLVGSKIFYFWKSCTKLATIPCPKRTPWFKKKLQVHQCFHLVYISLVQPTTKVRKKICSYKPKKAMGTKYVVDHLIIHWQHCLSLQKGFTEKGQDILTSPRGV